MRRGPSKTLVFAFAIVILGGAALAAAYSAGFLGPQYVRAEDLQRVIIVAASPDDSGSAVGQIIAVFDVEEGTVAAVSPALPVTIPGTSYDSLGDAYPFGGGAGTARAFAAAADEDVLPYVAISPEQLESAVEAAGGITVSLPEQMSVFDGETVYSLKAGEQRLGAKELQAVLKGAPYLSSQQRSRLDESLAAAVVELLAAVPETLDSADTDLTTEAIVRLRSAL